MTRAQSKIQSIKILTIGQGLNTIINILFLPYLARTMSYTEYGSYGQTLLVVDLFKTLLMMGLPQLVFVFLAQKKLSEKTIISNSALSGFLLGIAGLLILSLSSPIVAQLFNNERLRTLITIYACSALFQLPAVNLNSVFVFRHHVRKSVIIQVLGNIVKIGLVFVSVQFYHSLEYVMISIVISFAFQFFMSLLFLQNDIQLSEMSFKSFIGQINQGFPLGLTGVIGAILLASDGYMVSSFLTLEDYAVFRNGALEVPFISIIYGSIAAIILPEVSKLFQQNKLNEIVELKRLTIKNTAALIYPIMIFLMYFSKKAISFYLGEMYTESGIIFMIYTFALFIRVNDYSDVLISAKKTTIVLIAYTSALIINIALNILFIQTFGSKGAALATIISLFVLAGIQLVYTIKILNVSFIDFIDIKSIIVVFIVSGSLLPIMDLFLTTTTHVIPIACAVSIYFLIIYISLYKLKIIDRRIVLTITPKWLSKWV
jgi:O-antigen/teichoic acid export membrane protein